MGSPGSQLMGSPDPMDHMTFPMSCLFIEVAVRSDRWETRTDNSDKSESVRLTARHQPLHFLSDYHGFV